MHSRTVGKSFFFSKYTPLRTEDISSQRSESENAAQVAAQVIQQWWKQIHLKQTAKESSQYIKQVASLEQAQKKSFLKLEEFALNKNTQAMTHKLLMHLDQAKDLIIPSRIRGPNLHRPERIFLSAYLIAVKSDHIFESPTDIDELLLTQACDMLKSFEKLCLFMSETYMKHYPLSHSQENIQNDLHFIAEGSGYLKDFHHTQMAYYETFSQWESNNRMRLAKICITKYSQIETKRLAIFINPDPRQIEIYERFGNQQETLQRKIKDLLGEEGLTMLSHEVQKSRAAHEASKWLTAPKEVLLHELALNPEFKLLQETCTIHPKKDFDSAIAALSKEPVDIEPIADLIEEMREQIALLTPHNITRIKKLHEELSRKKITDTISAMGLEKGLCTLISSLIENIKELESPEHVPETIAFQHELEQKLRSGKQTSIILKDVLDFIYHKLSQINLEISNFNIKQVRPMLTANAVGFEQKKFQEHLEKNQFNLATVLTWIDTMIKSPSSYRLNTSTLCSKYIPSYLSHAIFIEILQKPGNLDLYTIPEPFYLDRQRLINWHEKYLRIFYTAIAMGYLDTFCQKYEARLIPDELLTQRKILMSMLEIENLSDSKEIASQIICTLKVLLTKKGKRFSEPDEKTLTKVIEEICTGNHLVATIMKKRLGDQLSFYLFKGYLPPSQMQSRLYGLETEIGKLGQEMRPLLGHHIKVHGEFYKHNVEERLWKPLFVMLRDPKVPEGLPSLFSPAQDIIYNAHAFIHKTAFLFTGLSLIQQTIVHQDMWGLSTGPKYFTMKELARSIGLINILHDPTASKDQIEKKLIDLMRQVAKDQKLIFEDAEEQKMRKMLRLAKNGKSPVCKTFLDELAEVYKQFTKQGKKSRSDSNLLIAVFKEELDTVCEQVQGIITHIKQALQPDDTDPVLQTIPTLRTGRGFSF